MNKAKSPKTKDTDKKKKTSKSLKTLQADQKNSSRITNKSLFSLKKVQKQLSNLISEREIDHLLLKKLKKNTRIVSKQIQQTEKKLSNIDQQSKNTVNKELLQLKNNFQKKNSQLTNETDKLVTEIISLNNLVKRVDSKIISLEKESSSGNKSLKNNSLLLTKVKQFEEQLNQLKDTFINPDKEAKEFAKQLKKLRKIVKQDNTNYQEHDIQIKYLQSNIKQLLHEDKDNFQTISRAHQKDIKSHKKEISQLQKEFTSQKDNIQHQHELINNTNKELSSLSPAIDKLLQKQATVSNETHSIAEAIEKLRVKTNSWKEDLNTQISNQSQAALVSAQGIAQQLNKQKQRFKQQFKDQKNQNKQHNLDLKDRISSLQEKHKKQTAPLKTHIRELKHTIEMLQEKLQNSHIQLENDLKNKIQFIQDTNNNENSQQFQELKQKIAIQSQHIEDNKQQFSQLSMIVDTSDANSEQLEQLSKKLNLLTSRQDELSESEGVLQTSISALTEQLNNEYSAQKIHLEDIINEQESQQDSFNQLNKTLTKRSQLFLVGLVATILISSIIFYYQDKANQSLPDNVAQKLIVNKDNSRINQLEQQNQALSQQFNDLKSSITAIKNQNEEQLLQNALQNTGQQSQSQPISQSEYTNWEEELELLATDLEENQALLEYNLSLTQEDQTSIKQTISELSIRIESMASQLERLQQSTPWNSEQNSAVIDINSISHPYYAIQLLGSQEQESAVKFIQQHNLSGNNQIIKTEYQNKPWYILVQGQYLSFTNAKKDLELLPEVLRINKPWIKKLP